MPRLELLGIHAANIPRVLLDDRSLKATNAGALLYRGWFDLLRHRVPCDGYSHPDVLPEWIARLRAEEQVILGEKQVRPVQQGLRDRFLVEACLL